ncbi:hypothetical protein RRG08_062865 [Elysia crispata]|uniref:Uncharacterized protein n=1 Tax=Elysia crispata TaxID=231223 RepID=A0AAE1CX39_9GAST|nr:hypothetical protein RRG08_062865 [Elysia crispata]
MTIVCVVKETDRMSIIRLDLQEADLEVMKRRIPGRHLVWAASTWAEFLRVRISTDCGTQSMEADVT